jgi:hypothetical protein
MMFSTFAFLFFLKSFKGKTPSKGTREEKRKDKSPKAQNMEWEALKGEIK